MEIKKSPRADLERKKPLWFFAALVINISIFVAVLECSPSESDISTEQLARSVENMAETTEMLPAETSVPAPAEKKLLQEDAVSDDIEVVENTDVAEIIPPAPAAGKDSVIVEGSSEEDDRPIEREEVVTDLKLLEELPSYPGGMSKFVRWLTENLKYPQQARKLRQQGTVLASFIIGKDGTVSDIAVSKPLSKECDEEVLRVLNKMDRWIPGKRNGKPCRTMFCIPIEFKL